jgi:hypothetical protein
VQLIYLKDYYFVVCCKIYDINHLLGRMIFVMVFGVEIEVEVEAKA